MTFSEKGMGPVIIMLSKEKQILHNSHTCMSQ